MRKCDAAVDKSLQLWIRCDTGIEKALKEAEKQGGTGKTVLDAGSPDDI